MTSVVLGIEGMSCAGCVASVEKALRATDGVTDVSVNFASESAVVEGNAGVELLITSVKQAGYRASVYELHDPAEESERLTRSLRSALLRSAMALALGVILMADMYMSLLPAMTNTAFWLGMTAVTAAAMWAASGHFYVAAIAAARHGRATMDTLIMLGTGAAVLYSLVVLIFPSFVPPEAHHLYLEAAVFIMGFVSLGKAIEIHSRGKASLAVKQLLELAPQTAQLVEDGIDREVPVSQVYKGALLRIRPGDAIPVDGVILEGESSIDESLVTGEPLPVNRNTGDVVIAGTVNQLGTLLIEAQKVGSATTLARIVELTAEAQNTKPPIGHVVDGVAAIFVPIVIGVALLASATWWIIGPEPSIAYAITVGISVLVIACPCALGLAVPMSIMVGMGRAAGDGLLIRNADALQTTSRLTTLALDKTGTVTVGRPEVTGVSGDDEHLVLKIAASLERNSEHPLADAITAYAKVNGTAQVAVESFLADPGGGVQGVVNGSVAAAGSFEYLARLGFESAGEASDEIGTTVYVGLDNVVIGAITLVDEAKPTSRAAIDELRKLGLDVIMLTGDAEMSASRISAEVDTDYLARMQPQDKLDYIKAAQARGEVVGMVGDGVNDAPALAAADVSFAMGQGADIAIAGADVTLLKDDLTGILLAIRQSRAVMRNIYQNLTAAFAYNTLLIPVAAGVLYPLGGPLINPTFAGLAMAASSVSVVLNAARLRLAS